MSNQTLFCRKIKCVFVCGVLFGFTAGVTACGDGSGSNTVNLPYEDDQQLSDLTAEDISQVCEAQMKAIADLLVPSICAMQGIAMAALGQGSCKGIVAACSEQQMDEFIDESVCDLGDTTTECDATIGEIESCMNAILKMTDDLMPKISCASTVEELAKLTMPDVENLDMPQACNAIADKCGAIANAGFSGLDFSDMSGFSDAGE